MPNTKNITGPVAQPAHAGVAPEGAPAPKRLRPLAGGMPVALDPVAVAAALAASNPGTARPARQKAPKLVRHSFKVPKPEYKALEALKDRASTLGRRARKSELLRAGIATLSTMSDEALLASLAGVAATRRKRPGKG